MFLVDFYLPKRRLVIEINGKSHFYPYINKKSSVTNFKSKVLREQGRSGLPGYFVLNLNAQILHGLSKEPDKLEDFLARMLHEAKRK